MRTLFSSLPLAGILLFAACESAEHEHAEHNDPMAGMHAEMMKADSASKAQEAMAARIIELFNNHNVDGLEALMNDDFVDHQQDPSITTTGMQGAKDYLNMIFTAYPDFKQEIISMSTTGDKTYIHLRMTGTNSGPWGAMPATNKAMDVMGCDVIRFANGKASEHWGYMEEMKMMTQLGLIPPPDAPKKK